ncbi:S41 family peptidase [Christiangramia sp. SM2212]|uniref:S41 family peptidase n=1 Tax=Christiangramia sediminicola TaxID=3073267 RepID=A0ABU1ERV7_9FLAO|nr:S41 family peptidase [Christiangramia sp. SM2212]MDR5591109.1 S41 family peptidase [Christiangramia sp. SM2212]
MKTFFFPLLLIICSLSCTAQSVKKFNLDFEYLKSDTDFAKDWIQWGTYQVSIDTLTVQSGKYATQINSKNSEGEFGGVVYQISGNYEGEMIKLEGFMKTKEVKEGFAGLLLRVDGRNKILAGDNMEERKISGTTNWTKYIITFPYPKDASSILVGGILAGQGMVWFDDFKLFIDGKNIQSIQEKEKPVFKADQDDEFDSGSNVEFPALNEKLVADLELLGRIWGFMKYYHPEIGKGNFNWDYELFRMLNEYTHTSKNKKRDMILLDWIAKYGRVEVCKSCKAKASNAYLKPDLHWIQNANINQELKNQLLHVYQNRHQGEKYYLGLGPAENPEFLNENAYSDMPYPDEGFRLLSLYRYWNMIQYFFPYRYIIDENWNEILPEYIPQFLSAEDELEYEAVVLKLIGEVQDTHANLYDGNDKLNIWKGEFYPPVHVRFIEDKLVVTDYYNPELKESTGLEIGDVITHINDKPIGEIIEMIKNYYPASNEAVRMRDLSADLLRSQKDQINIKYDSGAGTKEKTLDLYKLENLDYYSLYRKNSKKSYKMLDENVGYINLKSIKTADTKKIKKDFKNTKGIIIDIRNYPSAFVPFSLGSYFVSSPTQFAKFTKFNINNPGEFTFKKGDEIPPSDQTYEKPLVVIVNEITQSSAEYTAMALRAGKNTTIIGSTTAGADGNVSPILLPGGLRTLISGIGVYYPDGTATQRIGIIPDIEVKLTIEGIRAGRDELIEKAIEIIEKKNERH